MAKKYLTPDFDVTVYDIKDVLTLDIGGEMDGDDLFGDSENISSFIGTEED